MSKKGEIEYLDHLGEHGIAHAINKPFSDPECGTYLVRIGALMLLLPTPPVTLLDFGCGTGWTSAFFAEAGYHVTGVDISPTMIKQAQTKWKHIPNLTFVVWDYETLGLKATFDCAVFFDALHHATDEKLALATAYRALKPGGLCVTDEPGTGHSQTPAARSAMTQYGVTEKDMPPKRITQLAREAGFQRTRVVPSAQGLAGILYASRLPGWPHWFERLTRFVPGPVINALRLLRLVQNKCNHGLCVLYK
jgi:ubiquinone/menaquinone biosynthesis C-methylase UbiE